MNKICQKVQHLLSLYVENVLETQENELVKSHLSDCLECQQHLKLMQHTIESLKNLEKLDAPKDFLINLQQKISSKSFIQRIKEIIFFPFYLENPMPFASIAAVLVLVVFLQKTSLHNKITIDSIKDIKKGYALNKHARNTVKKEIESAKIVSFREKQKKAKIIKPVISDNKSTLIINNETTSNDIQSIHIDTENIGTKKDSGMEESCVAIMETYSEPVVIDMPAKINQSKETPLSGGYAQPLKKRKKLISSEKSLSIRPRSQKSFISTDSLNENIELKQSTNISQDKENVYTYSKQEDSMNDNEIEINNSYQELEEKKIDTTSLNRDEIIITIKEEIKIAEGKIIKIENISKNRQLIEIEINTAEYQNIYQKLKGSGTISPSYLSLDNKNSTRMVITIEINYNH